MRFVNLTPHQINIFDEQGNEVLQVPKSGKIARIKTETAKVKEIANVLLFVTQVTGKAHLIDTDNNELDEPFPPELQDTIYIVSGMFRQHFDRPDLYQPGQLLRNDSGNPIGCIGLSR